MNRYILCKNVDLYCPISIDTSIQYYFSIPTPPKVLRKRRKEEEEKKRNMDVFQKFGSGW